MTSLLRYQFINYFRTYHYVPPFTIFILCLVVNYTFVPNPILDSYSFTSLLLFFLMGWFTVTLFHAEDEGQKIITTLHTRSPVHYNLGILIICGLIAFSLSCVSIIYPILIDAFFERPKGLHILLGFLSHFSLSLLSIALTALFTRELVKNRQNTWWGVLCILIISVVIATIKNNILQINGLIWLLPPVHLSLEMMSIDDQIKGIPNIFFWQFAWIFIYTSFIVLLFFFLANRKRK
ncbi:ABC transporter permease [Lysinibacillus cavernae]|uniref:ABC transporter permease n=1 Tax=Lysinibacillus cavernae TaxID=2666135 RepID=UPI0012D88DC9|nr:ABC transporter permease [Lysinibacillus cavernae]